MNCSTGGSCHCFHKIMLWGEVCPHRRHSYSHNLSSVVLGSRQIHRHILPDIDHNSMKYLMGHNTGHPPTFRMSGCHTGTQKKMFDTHPHTCIHMLRLLMMLRCHTRPYTHIRNHLRMNIQKLHHTRVDHLHMN